MGIKASEAAAQAGQGESVIGWKLDRDQRRTLLRQFPPQFETVIADHVTLRSKAADDAPLPEERIGEIIGRVSDDAGVEAMVVTIDGTTNRPDGSSYHITWSLADGRHARESNDVLRQVPWERFERPEPITLQPAIFR